MAKSFVSSHTIRIHICRDKNEEGIINLLTPFENDMDILDIIEIGLRNPDAFDLRKQSEIDNNQVIPQRRKIRLVDEIEKCIIYNENNKSYKYLFFKIKHGENGDSGSIEKPDGTINIIEPQDHTIRDFYVFIAYTYYDDAKRGVLLLENKGSHGVLTPMKSVINKSVKLGGANNHTTIIENFADHEVINGYINGGYVEKLKLIKNSEPAEHGDGMRYNATELTFSKPREGGVNEMLTRIVQGRFNSNEPSNIRQVDEFNPDYIKFEVKKPNGTKSTYSTKHMQAGIMQEEMPSNVVLADGTTNRERILEQMKRIFSEQHLR